MYEIENPVAEYRSDLGFNIAAHARWSWGFATREIESNSPWMFYIPYMEGLYKLLLLRLGLDEINHDIEEGHALHSVVADLKEIANTGAKNPWRDESLNRGIFLQYHIAKLFVENPELFEKAKKVIDFAQEGGYAPWQTRIAFWDCITDGALYNKSHEPYDIGIVKKFLTSDEQALALHVCQFIRFFWYGALNHDIAMNLLGGASLSDFQRFKQLALSPIGDEGYSFFDVWHEIVSALISIIDRKNFVSFDDHGWIISFDQRIINAQIHHLKGLTGADAQMVDIALLKTLGCTGIESWQSSELYSFYKRPRDQVMYDALRLRLDKIKLFQVLTKRFDRAEINAVLDQAMVAIKAGEIAETDRLLEGLKRFDRAANIMQGLWRRHSSRSKGLFQKC